jgi:hypothetical protein
LSLILPLLLIGCAGQPKPVEPLPRNDDYRYQPRLLPFDAPDMSARIERRHLSQRVDRLILLLEQSQAMAARHRGQTRADYQREILRRLLLSLPAEMRLEVALVIYGDAAPCQSLQGRAPQPFRVDQLRAALESGSFADAAEEPCAVAYGRLATALAGLPTDWLQPAASSRVLVLGTWGQIDEAASDAAGDLFKRHGQALCVDSVGVGNVHADPRLSPLRSCGVSVSADRISSGPRMADFAESLFFSDPEDSDGDGIADYQDACADTPAGLPVRRDGCLRDSSQGHPRYPVATPEPLSGIARSVQQRILFRAQPGDREQRDGR